MFTVFQDVYLKTTNDPRVSNIVKFSDFIGELKVEVSFFFFFFTLTLCIIKTHENLNFFVSLTGCCFNKRRQEGSVSFR